MKLLKAGLIGLAATAAGAGAATAQSVCLITKDATNPFFVKMAEGAFAKAAELGVELRSFAGKFDGDHETQVAAIETCMAADVDGILLVASDTKAITSVVEQAREAGTLVIALDTPLDPIDAADMTFATDNFEAGRLIGEWAAKTMGDTSDAKIGLLNINVSQPTVGVLRNQGFLTGFGVDIGDPNRWGDEDDPRISGQELSSGNAEGGREGMENLLAIDPDINVVYTINEPAAAGAYEALRSFGKEDDVLIVSVDGGCPGVEDVAAGVIGATAQQYPLRMAALGVEAVATYAENGEVPEATEGKDFFDTGVGLVTDAPVEGMDQLTVEEGLELCWG
ncbi:sugar ABC transporter substrate-binding protein [Rhodovulum sp. 12E13]|uniref:sugar ABC transporter substrate-binding protein n=1 Tax=Rhodovulum sp. 12E13 TaxID=2203891 RepID=UPI000E1AA256|nr:sugar ABC transporter substrate-binding protein [Rhodovulum sp. 12E13]RDC71267.1 sugar ABC transporter substrate-binding protein [Rhodovulum sp. 12E13]